MRMGKRGGRWLFLAITATLVIAVVFLVWSFFFLEKRSNGMTELAMQRTHQLLNIRLDGYVYGVEEDLREEASAVAVSDSGSMAERWIPLLNANWTILHVELADEYGNLSLLTREDSTFLLMQSVGGPEEAPPIMMRFDAHSGDVVQGPWLGIESRDPRNSVWYSKALEDTRDEPVWSLVMDEGSGSPRLLVSYLVRGRRGEPFRILSFAVDPARSPWMDSRSTALLKAGLVLLDDEGRTLAQLSGRTNETLTEAIAEMVENWKVKKRSAPFHVQADGKRYDCVVGTYPVHGQQLFTGLAVELAPLRLWMMPEWIGLWSMTAIIVTLTILLLVAWFHERRREVKSREQVRKSKAQELKLAKAIGEREVLNREVHHRVKNNLQVVSSLLNIQATRLDDGLVKNEFLRGKRRIDTIALVHHKLYGLSDLRNVDLFRFFNGLVSALGDMYSPQSRSVSTEVHTQAIMADQDTAIELGIILCELVSNTYQHAFPYATGGHVEIRIQPVEGDLYRLTVKDNGTGLPESGPMRDGKLGLEIVEALAEQLDGSFTVSGSSGVLFEVLFRMKHKGEPTE